MRKNKKPFVPYWLLKMIAWIGYVGLPVVLFFIPNVIRVYRSGEGSGTAIFSFLFGSPVLLITIFVLYFFMHRKRT